MAFETIAAADVWIIAIAIVVYVCVTWIPCFISLYLVYNRANDKRSEKEFDQRWYKWKKQYMWHEVIFRSHVIFVMAFIVVVIFEKSWPLWAATTFPIGFIFVTIFIKYTSKKVENRVPSDDEKKLLYQSVTGTMRSVSDAREYMTEITEEMDNSNGVERINSDSHLHSPTNTTKNGENGSTETKMKQGIELQQRTNGSNQTHHE